MSYVYVLGPRSSRIVLAIVAVAAAFYAFVCIGSFRASELASSRDLSKQILATRVEPQNADYWRQLGAAELYQENDAQGALSALQHATNLNGRDADAWMAMALALQLLGRRDEEHVAISRALAAEPRRLGIIWQAENLYTTLDDPKATLNEGCVLLIHDQARGASAMLLARSVVPGATAADCQSQEGAR